MSDRLLNALLDERDRRIVAEDEAKTLRRKVQTLDAKLIEVTSPDLAVAVHELRDAYRAGYFAGRHARSRNRPLTQTPEADARGKYRRRLNVG